MASPQRENGHVRIANELFDEIVKLRLAGSEWQVLMFVIRKTYGWSKKSDFISLTQFQKETGLSRPRVCEAIARLVNKNILVKERGSVNKYMLQKDYDQWVVKENGLVKETELVKENGIASKGKRTRTSNENRTKSSKGNRTHNNHIKDNIKNIITKDNIADTRLKSLIDHHFQNYQRKFGKKYVVSGKKDADLLKKLLNNLSEEEIKKLNDVFFESDDEFVQKSGYTIGVFYSQINKLQISRSGRKEPKSWPALRRVAAKLAEEKPS